MAGAQMIGSVGAQISNVSGLDLSDNGFNDEGLSLIIESLYNCQSLTMLDISKNFSKDASTSKREKLVTNLIHLINHTECPLEGTSIPLTLTHLSTAFGRNFRAQIEASHRAVYRRAVEQQSYC